MYDVTEEFKTAIKQPSRDFLLTYMTVNGVRTTADDIQEFTIEQSNGSSDKLTIGNANASKLSAVMIITDNTPADWVGEVKPVSAMTYGETTTDIPLGVYYIDKTTVKITGLQVTFDAFDLMYSLDDVEYDGKECADTRELIGVLGGCGVPIYEVSTYPSLPWKKALQGLSVREIIAELALLFGSNAMFDRFGKLVFVKSTSADFPIDGDNYITFAKEDNGISTISKLSTTVITTVTQVVTDEDGEEVEEEVEVTQIYTSGDDTGTTLEISSDNIRTQAELDSLYSRANMPISYQPYSLESQGFVHLDCGDVIGLTTAKGMEYSIPIVYHQLRFNGGFISTLKALPIAEEEKKKKKLSESINAIKESVSAIDKTVQVAKGDAASALLAAEEANKTADNSFKAAATAQAAADGKNSVFYLDGQNDSSGNPTVVPTGTTAAPLKVNDLWFNTGYGNCSYRWNGESWERKGFGSAAIDNLDAGKITAHSITAEQLAIDAIKSANYVPDSSGSYLSLLDGTFDSKYLKWDKEGKITVSNATIRDGSIEFDDSSTYGTTFKISKNVLEMTGRNKWSGTSYFKIINDTEGDGITVSLGKDDKISGGNILCRSAYIDTLNASYIDSDTAMRNTCAYRCYDNTKVARNMAIIDDGNNMSLANNGCSGILYIGNLGNSSTYLRGKGVTVGLTNDGSARFYCDAIYGRTYSSGSTVTVTSAGTLGRISSATKYKLNIGDIAEDESYPYRILELNPKQWFDKKSCVDYADALTNEQVLDEVGCGIDSIYGLIAEDLENAGLEKFCLYNDRKELEGVQYDRLWILMIPILKKICDKLGIAPGKDE